MWQLIVDFFLVSWKLDAPGWREHIYKNNQICYFGSLEPIDASSLSPSIQDLVYPPYSGKDATFIKLICFPNLQSIHIASFSFPSVAQFEVKGLGQLKEFVVENNSFTAPHFIYDIPFVIEDCPLLETITIGYGCFAHFQFSVKSHRKGTE